MRFIKLKTLCLMPAALALLVSAAPQHAEAQVCKALKGVKKSGCVRSGDVKDESLTHNDVKNMAGTRSFRFGGGGGMAVPTKGWVSVSALTRVDASGAAGPVEVVCRLIPSGSAPRNAVPVSVRESLNPTMGVSFASIGATKIYAVRKGTLNIAYQCSQNAAGVEIQPIDLTAKFVPTRYKAKR